MDDIEKSLNEKLDLILSKNTETPRQYELGDEVESMSQDAIVDSIRKINNDIASTLSIMSSNSSDGISSLESKFGRVTLAAKKLLYEQTGVLHKLSMKLLVDEEESDEW